MMLQISNGFGVAGRKVVKEAVVRVNGTNTGVESPLHTLVLLVTYSHLDCEPSPPCILILPLSPLHLTLRVLSSSHI